MLVLTLVAPASALDCADAPALLGHPTARATRCYAFPHLADLYEVTLEGGDLATPTAIVVALRDGAPIPERGDRAAVDFLRAEGYDRLDADEATGVLQAFDAWPPGFGRGDQYAPDGGDPVAVTRHPLSVTIYAMARGDGGGPPARTRIRAVLAPDASGRFGWTFAAEAGGGWRTTSTRSVDP